MEEGGGTAIGIGVDKIVRARWAAFRENSYHVIPFSTYPLSSPPNCTCTQVDALRANGALHVSIWTEQHGLGLADVEIGRLEVPLGAAMDCCHGSGGSSGGGNGSGSGSGSGSGGGGNVGGRRGVRRYVRWFPLLLPADAASVVGDQGESLKPDRGEEADDSHFRDFIPCLQVHCTFLAFVRA